MGRLRGAAWSAATLLLLLPLLCDPRAAAWRPGAPFHCNVSLDVAPEQRWVQVMRHFDPAFLRSALAQVIDAAVPKWVHAVIRPIAEEIELYIPQPFAGEIRGLCQALGVNVGDGVLLNMAYESTAYRLEADFLFHTRKIQFQMISKEDWKCIIQRVRNQPITSNTTRYCTSIVAQDNNGNIYHGRNLDYPFGDVLRKVTIDVDFLKNGKVLYQGTTFFGYIGLWTGQSPYKFTISGDERDNGKWWENAIAAFLNRDTPVSWLVRTVLAEAESFQVAARMLAEIPIIADVYYIIGGARPKEGMVITRSRRRAVDIWPLDPASGGWYRVETNYDHWKSPPPFDDRRTPAIRAMNATGQKNINLESLYNILSMYPVLNNRTIYTTVMSAGAPDKYMTQIRFLA